MMIFFNCHWVYGWWFLSVNNFQLRNLITSVSFWMKSITDFKHQCWKKVDAACWTSGGQTDTRRQHINAHAQKYDFRCPHTFGRCSLTVCNNGSCSSSSSITLSSEGYHHHPDPSSPPPPPPHTFCPHGSPQPRPQGSASTERSSNCRLVTKRITGPVGDSGQPKADYTGHYREGRRAKETRRCQRA